MKTLNAKQRQQMELERDRTILHAEAEGLQVLPPQAPRVYEARIVLSQSHLCA